MAQLSAEYWGAPPSKDWLKMMDEWYALGQAHARAGQAILPKGALPYGSAVQEYLAGYKHATVEAGGVWPLPKRRLAVA